MANLLVPLTKSPWSKGRWGKKENQDWYVGLVKTKNYLNEREGDRIALISNVYGENQEYEIDIYKRNIMDLGVSEECLICAKECFETSGQINRAIELSKELDLNLVLISSAFHYPRVMWLVGDENVEHLIFFGIPRPLELITDMILSFVYPVIDVFGLNEVFTRLVIYKRRKFGY